MPKYLLADRERNLSDDSDFYAIFYDSDADNIGNEEYGSTRYAGGRRTADPAVYLPAMPDDVREPARQLLVDGQVATMRAADERDRNEPDSAQKGESLVLLKSGFCKDKQTGCKIAYSEGATGTVIWVGAFGIFYRNGYKRVGRSTLRVGLKLTTGEVIFVGLDKCRRARAAKPEAELVNLAHYNVRMNYPQLYK